MLNKLLRTRIQFRMKKLDFARKQKPLAVLKNLSILTLIASFCMGVSSCPTNPNGPEFDWNPKIYAGDSGAQAIARGTGSKFEMIRCSDQRFDQMVCTNKSEIRKAQQAANDIINACERWKPGAKLHESIVIIESLNKFDLE